MSMAAITRLALAAGLAACAAPPGRGETTGLPFSPSAQQELDRLQADLQSAPVQAACTEQERRHVWLGILLFGVAAEADQDPERWGWTRQSAPLLCWVNAVDAGKDVRQACPQPTTPLDSRLFDFVVEYQSLGGENVAVSASCSAAVNQLM